MVIFEITVDDVGDIKNVATALHSLLSSAEPHTDTEHRIYIPMLDQLASIMNDA